MADAFVEIIENASVIFEYLKSTKNIRGYTVETDLTLRVGQLGECAFVAMFPTLDSKDTAGNVVREPGSEFLTTHDMSASELAAAIKDDSISSKFFTAEEDQNRR